MNVTRLILFISAVLVVITTGLECPWSGFLDNEPLFGAKCMYRCHCVGDVQCNFTTGECTGGCAAGWTGPGCQYSDIAYQRPAVRSTQNPTANTEASRAVDSYADTCSRTKWAYEQWWKVDLGTTFKLFGLSIESDEAYALAGFQVRIGNVSSSSPSGFPGICFQHFSGDGINRVTEVKCTTEHIGRHIMIWLPGITKRLSLCDVRVYSVCSTDRIDICSQLCGKCMNGTLCDAAYGTCVDGCQHGWWNLSCKSSCGHCRENTACSRLDGYCFECPTGKWGPLCTNYCVGCKNGTGCTITNGICLEGCLPGLFGLNCSQKCGYCSEDGPCDRRTGKCLYGCLPGWTHDDCNTVCPSGKFGQNCDRECGRCTDGLACHHIEGKCENGCSPGYNGSLCSSECIGGSYGLNCSETCGFCINDTICDHIDGTCQKGCQAGYIGAKCKSKCIDGLYGQNCSEKCGFCFNITYCNHIDGACENGCASGYTDDVCKTICPPGRFGPNCSQKCGHCADAVACYHLDGKCIKGCYPGYYEPMCTLDCQPGRFGQNCSHTCGHCADDLSCHHIDGTCLQGCYPGYYEPMCTLECRAGLYGTNCSQECGLCFNDTVCEYKSGKCEMGCTSEYTGDICKTAIEERQANEEGYGAVSAAAAAGGTVGPVILILIVVVVIILLRRRRPLSKKLGDNIIPKDETMMKHDVSNMYENISALKPEVAKNALEPISNLTYNSCVKDCEIELTTTKNKNEREPKSKYLGEEKNLHCLKDETELEILNIDTSNERFEKETNDDTTVYCNSEKKRILVDDLEDYVNKGVYCSRDIELEFKALVSGPQSKMNVALRQNNRQKNSILAHGKSDSKMTLDNIRNDNTRVVLDPLPEDPDSDYINACFIRGYKRDKAYIAAQGPTTTIVNDFWRMVWQYNIDKIVMLTGLYEKGKQKCYQYWPSKGSVEFGTIKVETIDEEICTEYTIRFLNVTQMLSKKQKMLTQFHFTAWLDRDIPDSPATLVQFWNKVRHTGAPTESPTLVHCSAGIGRTGTYIAFDCLYEEGTAEGSMHVFDCINGLRRQRVGMVQNAEQYVYLHEVLVEALVRTGKRVDVDEFSIFYQEMSKTDPKNKQSKLFLEYQSLQDKGQSYLESALTKSFKNPVCEQEDEYAYAKSPENRMKNRYDNIIPSRKYCPILSSYVAGRNNYINAVCLPTRKNKNGLIMTQMPLPDTVVDFWRLVLEYDVQTLVMLNDENLQGEEIGIYWPARDTTCQFGPFTATTVSETRKGTHIERMLHVSKEGQEEILKVKQYVSSVCTSRGTETSGQFVTFLEDVNRWQGQSENRPIVVHCINGAEHSGLFCVLWCVLERIKADREVAIRSVVRQMRVRRQHIIPSFEQYQFCHDVILEYLTNFVTYTNF